MDKDLRKHHSRPERQFEVNPAPVSTSAALVKGVIVGKNPRGYFRVQLDGGGEVEAYRLLLPPEKPDARLGPGSRVAVDQYEGGNRIVKRFRSNRRV